MIYGNRIFMAHEFGNIRRRGVAVLSVRTAHRYSRDTLRPVTLSRSISATYHHDIASNPRRTRLFLPKTYRRISTSLPHFPHYRCTRRSAIRLTSGKRQQFCSFSIATVRSEVRSADGNTPRGRSENVRKTTMTMHVRVHARAHAERDYAKIF